MTTPPHIPTCFDPVQQLPQQYGDELHHLHDEPLGGERSSLRLLSQRVLHEPGHERRPGHGIVRGPFAHEWSGLHHLPRQGGQWLHQLVGGLPMSMRLPTPIARLPQRHDGDRQHDAAAHPGRAAIQCSNCHTNTATSFTTYTMNHSAVSASRCDACHNGSYTAEGTKGAQGTASYPNHVATGGRDCGHLPRKAAASFVELGGRYSTLHQAERHQLLELPQRHRATGMTTPPHIPVAGVQCSNCHTNTAASFTTYTMNHAAVSASRCDSCHNGSYTSEGTKGALGTASYANHVATNGQDCVTLPCQCGGDLHELGRRDVRPPGDRYELLEPATTERSRWA